MVEKSKVPFVVHIDKSDICNISISPQTSTSTRVIGCSILVIVFLYFYSSQPHHLTPYTDIDNSRKSRPRQIGFRNNAFSAVLLFDPAFSAYSIFVTDSLIELLILCETGVLGEILQGARRNPSRC